jgi:WD40 repeat protein
VSLSPDGTRIAGAWTNEGVVRVQDLGGDAPPVEIPARTSILADSTSFSPGGDRLAIAGETGVAVVDATTGDRLLRFRPGEGEVLGVGWSPDGRWIASGSAAR